MGNGAFDFFCQYSCPSFFVSSLISTNHILHQHSMSGSQSWAPMTKSRRRPGKTTRTTTMQRRPGAPTSMMVSRAIKTTVTTTIGYGQGKDPKEEHEGEGDFRNNLKNGPKHRGKGNLEVYGKEEHSMRARWTSWLRSRRSAKSTASAPLGQGQGQPCGWGKRQAQMLRRLQWPGKVHDRD